MPSTWLVGGAVRDALLGLPVTERDWVVVGSTPAEMEAAGFRQVGRDFPVFIHPGTGEEYALARTERKSGPGYRGFVVHAGPDVTLEADLARRDLTINAIARAPDGTLVDPHGGLADLAGRRLRHVSPAFREDPLRVLRAARFAARFAGLGFELAAETRVLMAEMVAGGELEHLVAERVWRETERALATPTPACYFDELAACGALAVVMPELAPHWPGPDRAAADALATASGASADSAVRLAAAAHGLDADTEWPALARRLVLPRRVERLGRATSRLWPGLLVADPADPDAVWDLLLTCDALRQPDRLDLLTPAASAAAAARGRDPDRLMRALRTALTAAGGVRGGDLAAEGWSGADLGAELQRRRRDLVRQVLAGG